MYEKGSDIMVCEFREEKKSIFLNNLEEVKSKIAVKYLEHREIQSNI